MPNSRFGSFGNEDCDPLRKNDPWMNCDSQGVRTIDTAVKEPWAAWQPQRLRRERARKFSLQHVPPQHWGDSSIDACDECCTSLVAQPSSAELGLTPMGIGRGEEDSNAKGDWRSMPCDTFESLYAKFPDSPLRTTPDDYVKQRWPSSRALRDAARHLRRYGYSATLPNDIHYAVDKGEVESLREVFKLARQANATDW